MEKVYCQHCDAELEVCEFSGIIDGLYVEEYVYDCMCDAACKERYDVLPL